jgi:hypothetical protein
MLKYTDLTKGQKRCIDSFIAIDPALATAETITTKEVQKLFWALHEQREDGAAKVGYPLWLSANNTISRGVFAFPGPNSPVNATVSTAKSKQTAASGKKKLDQIIKDSTPVEIDQDEFEAELRANGIQV